jgi:NADPH:quinone reductase-like Zn-dependent oxidoreductase
METMKAVRIHRFGGPEALVYEDAPRPEPGEGEVLVRVHAAGVNPIDWKIREGRLPGLHHVFPLIPGWDVSGTVEDPGGSDFAPGDEVFGQADVKRNGAYAEWIAIAADRLAPKPRSLDHRAAGALPLAALTARQAIEDAIALAPGQTVLIHGAAGGVGTFAVQLAKRRGARVIATASAANRDFLIGLGADRVVDYAHERFEDGARGVDAVLDTVGGETQARSWALIRPGGVLASIVGIAAPEEAGARGVRAVPVSMRPTRAALEEIGRLCDEGWVTPIVSEAIPLAEARRAQDLSQARHVRGKLVLTVMD